MYWGGLVWAASFGDGETKRFTYVGGENNVRLEWKLRHCSGGTIVVKAKLTLSYDPIGPFEDS